MLQEGALEERKLLEGHLSGDEAEITCPDTSDCIIGLDQINCRP